MSGLSRDLLQALADLVHHPLDADIVHQALGRLALLFESEAAAFFLCRHEGLSLISLAGPARQGFEAQGEAAATRAIEEASGLVCRTPVWILMSSPVRGDGRMLGALVLARGNDAPFSSDDLGILQIFTDLMGVGLRRERLEAQLADQFKKLERQDFRLFTISHVARVLGSILEMEELLRLLPDMVSEIVNAESAAVCLVADEDTRLVVRSSSPSILGRPAPDFSINLMDSLHEWIRGFQGQKAPVLSPGEAQVQEFAPGLAGELELHGFELFTPMLYKDRFIGVLAVGRKYTGGPYRERDLEFLSTLAPLASNAIANAQLYDLAIHDGTTGLFVAHYFRRRVVEELKRSRRYGYPVSVALFDLDYFKQVNDTFGHLTGDQVLREMGTLLRRSSRCDVDVVARYGGEEFVILMPETPQDGALVVAERLRRSLEDFTFCGGRVRLTTSGGVATFPDDAMSYEELLERADIQLYRAKRAGRNRICAADLELPLR